MLNSNLNWDRIPTKIKRAIEASLEHLSEHKFTLNDTSIEVIDDYCWDLIHPLAYLSELPSCTEDEERSIAVFASSKDLVLANNYLSRIELKRSLNVKEHEISARTKQIRHCSHNVFLVVCHLKQLWFMNLAHNKLKSLPSSISSLAHLQTLNLTNNHLQELPSSIVLLANLRILKLGHNQLSSLPRSFSSLKSLEILDLTGNDLTESSVNNEVFQLCNLRALYLGDNLFETFPNDHVDKLTNLQILVLRHNRLRHLPKELARLPQLKELHIQQNQINVLPPAFGQLDLGNVKHIYRFEPNPFIPELALQMSNPTRLASFLKSDVYKEIHQNYFLNFDDHESNETMKTGQKKNKHGFSKVK